MGLTSEIGSSRKLTPEPPPMNFEGKKSKVCHQSRKGKSYIKAKISRKLKDQKIKCTMHSSKFIPVEESKKSKTKGQIKK